MIAAFAGAIAGTLHVVSGPDHLAAVAPLAIRHPLRAMWTGAAWGLGHAAGVLVLGAAGVLARRWVSVDALSGWAELLVGGVLIGVGLWSLRQAKVFVLHEHPHAHVASGTEGHEHAHEHAHVHLQATKHTEAAHRRHTHAAFGVGMLHGAAGTGHLMGVLPSLALPAAQAVTYLIAYGLAAVGAMTLFGMALGRIGNRLRARYLRMLMAGAGVFAIGLGLYWVGSGWPPGN